MSANNNEPTTNGPVQESFTPLSEHRANVPVTEIPPSSASPDASAANIEEEFNRICESDEGILNFIEHDIGS